MKYQEKLQHFAAAAATVASTTKDTTTATTGAHRNTRELVPRASDEATVVPDIFYTAASDSEWKGASDDVLDVPVAEPATDEP
eukprot:16326444-Heterocapsa_arctica.AAC.1